MTRYDEWRTTAPEDARPENLPRAQRIDYLQRQIRAIESGIEDGVFDAAAIAETLAEFRDDLKAIERDTESAVEHMRYLAYGD